MATIRIVENTFIAGVPYQIGAIADIDSNAARELLVAGKAVPCAANPEKPMTKKKAGKRGPSKQS